MDVETVRVILERTFQMPVAESDAQIVLDRLNEILSGESRPTTDASDLAKRPDQMEQCGNCETYRAVVNGVIEKCPNCGDDEIELDAVADVIP